MSYPSAGSRTDANVKGRLAECVRTPFRACGSIICWRTPMSRGLERCKQQSCCRSGGDATIQGSQCLVPVAASSHHSRLFQFSKWARAPTTVHGKLPGPDQKSRTCSTGCLPDTLSHPMPGSIVFSRKSPRRKLSTWKSPNSTMHAPLGRALPSTDWVHGIASVEIGRPPLSNTSNTNAYDCLRVVSCRPRGLTSATVRVRYGPKVQLDHRPLFLTSYLQTLQRKQT